MATNTTIIPCMPYSIALCKNAAPTFGGNLPPKTQRIRNVYVRTYVHIRKITIEYGTM